MIFELAESFGLWIDQEDILGIIIKWGDEQLKDPLGRKEENKGCRHMTRCLTSYFERKMG